MRSLPHAFNGFLFQQNGQVASTWLEPYDWNIRGITTNNIARSQNFPLNAGKSYSGSVKVITVNFTDVDAYRDSLIIAMDALGDEQHQLLTLDEFGRAWYVDALCIGVNEEAVEGNTASFGVVFDVADPIWKKYDPSAKTIAVNGTGTGTIRPLGNQSALPVITITPTASGAYYGFGYKRFIQIINNSLNALIEYPLNLTGAGLDTAALVTAGKMLASGADLRIYVDGVEVKRWLQDMNTANTKIWINWTQPANTDMTLGDTIAATGAVGTITIQNAAANIALMPTIPTSGNVKIGSEIFVYTGVYGVSQDGTNVLPLQLTGCTRAARQTSMGAHAIGDAIAFVTSDVWMFYGFPAIAPYVTDDTHKPIIKLTSTNTSWIYEEFVDLYGNRTGGWAFSISGSGGTNVNTDGVYSVSENAASANPFQVMGARTEDGWIGNGSIAIRYDLFSPCGITTITATGKKYRSLTTWEIVTLQKSTSGYTWETQWTEADPATDLVWEALDAHAAVALGATYNYIKLNMDTVPTLPAHSGYHEIGDMTLGLDAAKVPTIVLASEASNFVLHTVMANAATGDIMALDLSMDLNLPLVINTKEKTVTGQDGTNQINALQGMPVRAEWFELLPAQDNVITITDAGVVTFLFELEDRAL
jgi:hypothetical protein